MGFQCIGAHQDIIHEHHTAVKVIQNGIHERSELSWGIGKAKGHDKIFIGTMLCHKSGFVNVIGENPNLVEAMRQVKF